MSIFYKILKTEEEYIVPLINTIKENIPCAVIPFQDAWARESTRNKLLAILKLNYKPNEKNLQEISKEIFLQEIFGTFDDMGELLYVLATWHFSRDWVLNDLTQNDKEKADALQGITLLTRKRYWELDSESLKLKLPAKNINICTLLCPVVAKIPIVSIQYFIVIDAHYSFNSIRKVKHKNADEIIAYLYETLTIQQEVSISFHSLMQSIVALSDKKDSILHKHEVDAIMKIKSIITALKASIEKSVLLLGYIFDIKNLESKKTHKAKLTALNANIPENVKKQNYYSFIEKFISTNELELLNRDRTGLLHKKGLSGLQPHSHYMKSNTVDNFTNFFYKLHDQHSKNSAIIIAVLAILTDELVKLDSPDFSMADIPCEELKKYFSS
jgi:hypothetical protein